jgi:SWI/SNF-related matrix-associated actin-dependent regulator of chromatin subfamily B protein 1
MCGACGASNSAAHESQGAHSGLGKYWHRYRRPRDVVYNTSEEYHRGLREAEEAAKRGTKYKKRPTAMPSVDVDTPDIEMLDGPPVDDEVKEEVEPTPVVQSPEPAPLEAMLAEEEAPKLSHPSPAFADMPFGESSDEEPIMPAPKTPPRPAPKPTPGQDGAVGTSAGKPPSPSKAKVASKASVCTSPRFIN